MDTILEDDIEFVRHETATVNSTTQDSGGYVKNSYFTVSACTEVLFKDDTFGCKNVTEKLRIARDSHTFFNISQFIFPYVGLVNNILSMIVLFQPKYSRRLLPLLMRCFYIFSFCVAFQIASVQLTKASGAGHTDSPIVIGLFRLQMYLANLFMKSADAVLAVMTVVRFVYCKDPFNLSQSEDYRKKAIIGIMVIVAFSAGIDFNFLLFPIQRSLMEAGHIKALVLFIYLCINITFSIAAVMYEKKRIEKLSTVTDHSVLSQVLGRRLSNYLCLSSMCFIVTTFPATIFLLLPHNPRDPLTCQSCINHWAEGYMLLNLATWNVYFDNWVYCLLSSEYRLDLKLALTRLLCPATKLRRIMSRNESFHTFAANPNKF